MLKKNFSFDLANASNECVLQPCIVYIVFGWFNDRWLLERLTCLLGNLGVLLRSQSGNYRPKHELGMRGTLVPAVCLAWSISWRFIACIGFRSIGLVEVCRARHFGDRRIDSGSNDTAVICSFLVILVAVVVVGVVVL